MGLKVSWPPDSFAFFIDAHQVNTVAQTIMYPMQFMLGLYEFRADSGAEVTEESYPKDVTVALVSGSRYRG